MQLSSNLKTISRQRRWIYRAVLILGIAYLWASAWYSHFDGKRVVARWYYDWLVAQITSVEIQGGRDRVKRTISDPDDISAFRRALREAGAARRDDSKMGGARIVVRLRNESGCQLPLGFWDEFAKYDFREEGYEVQFPNQAAVAILERGAPQHLPE